MARESFGTSPPRLLGSYWHHSNLLSTSSRGHGTALVFRPAFKTPEGCSPAQPRTFALLSELPAELSPTTHLPDLTARPRLLPSCAVPQKRARFSKCFDRKITQTPHSLSQARRKTHSQPKLQAVPRDAGEGTKHFVPLAYRLARSSRCPCPQPASHIAAPLPAAPRGPARTGKKKNTFFFRGNPITFPKRYRCSQLHQFQRSQ